MAVGEHARALLWRQWRQISRLYAYLTGAIGALGVLGGAFMATGTVPFTFLLGAGASLIAAALLALLALSQDSKHKTFDERGIDRAFLDRKAEFSDEDWTTLIRSAGNHYRILGVANHGYAAPQNADASREALRGAAERGVKIEVLWLDPDSPFAQARQEDEAHRTTRRDIARAMRWFFDLRESLDPPKQENILLKEYRRLPTCAVTWIDRVLIVTHYLAGELNLRSPGLVLFDDSAVIRALIAVGPAPASQLLARKYIAHYNIIKDSAVLIDQARVNTVMERYGEEAEAGKHSEAELRG